MESRCRASSRPPSLALAVLHTPATWAPNALASCTANVPTPPPAPMTRTFCPAATFPVSRRPCRAANPEVGTAACSNVTFAGLPRSGPVSGGVLGKGAGAGPGHFVAGSEPRPVLADRRHGSRDIAARHVDPGPKESEPCQPDGVGQARDEVESEQAGRAVGVSDPSSHGWLPGAWWRAWGASLWGSGLRSRRARGRREGAP